MPRATVHTRRDLPALLHALRLADAAQLPRRRVRAVLLDRHRAIDRNQDEEDQHLHFMRGHDEEDGAAACLRALGYAEQRAVRAAQLLRKSLARPKDLGASEEAVRAITDVLHVVRDSYSRGHVTRAPETGGNAVVGLRAWEDEKEAQRAFGLAHALLHDIRFEWPFSRFAPEVPASDEAVRHALTVVVATAQAADEGGFAALWTGLVHTRFLPIGSVSASAEGPPGVVDPQPGRAAAHRWAGNYIGQPVGNVVMAEQTHPRRENIKENAGREESGRQTLPGGEQENLGGGKENLPGPGREREGSERQGAEQGRKLPEGEQGGTETE